MPGLDFREIEDVVDQRQKSAAGALKDLDISLLLLIQIGLRQQVGHAQDGIERRPYLVAHGREKFALRLRRPLYLLVQARIVSFCITISWA